MKITRRILCVALALVLALGMTGCTLLGEVKTTPTPQGAGAVTPAPGTTDPTAQPTGNPVEMVETEDVVQRLLGFPRDTTLMTVDGVAVTAEDYLYCLSFSTEDILGAIYESIGQVDWSVKMGDIPLETYITDSAVETATFYAIIRAKAAEHGVTITAAEQAELDMYISSIMASLGGAEEYALRLQLLGISDEGFRALNGTSVLYDGLEEALFRSQPPTEEELIAYIEETADAVLAKHILIKTVDDANQPLPEEDAAAAKALAEDILAQLRASRDPLTLFDELMDQHSGDGRLADGTLAAAEGYLFGPGDMVEEFENGARALKYYEISDLVESEFGYHIILRLPPINDNVRESWVITKMNDQVTQWVSEAKVDTTEEFSKVGPKDYYEKLEAYRAELLAAEEGESGTDDGADGEEGTQDGGQPEAQP